MVHITVFREIVINRQAMGFVLTLPVCFSFFRYVLPMKLPEQIIMIGSLLIIILQEMEVAI